MREDIESFVKKYKVNTVVLRASFKELDKFIEDSERVLYVDAVNYVINPGTKLEIPFGMLKNANAAAMAVTNKRIIFISKILYTKNIKVIDLDKLQTWNSAKGPLSTILRMKTFTDVIDIELGIRAKKIECLTNLLTEAIERKQSNTQLTNQSNNGSPYDELKQLKTLLDMNIITQEEFEMKKKQLLNI